jgi:two-component system cell cycle response regulator
MLHPSISISLLGFVAAMVTAALLGGLAVFAWLRPRMRRLAELAAIDDLTQLYNSREFNRRLAQEVERAKRYHKSLSLVLVDIDNFKTVNDTYGYDAGDAVLKEFAQFVKSKVRSADVLFRYRKGDEFAILSAETTPAGAIAFTERLRQELAEHQFQIHPPSSLRPRRKHPTKMIMPITISAGITGFNLSNDTAETFRQRAERAMQLAKQTTNSVVVEEVGEVIRGLP